MGENLGRYTKVYDKKNKELAVFTEDIELTYDSIFATLKNGKASFKNPEGEERIVSYKNDKNGKPDLKGENILLQSKDYKGTVTKYLEDGTRLEEDIDGTKKYTREACNEESLVTKTKTIYPNGKEKTVHLLITKKSQ